jgi:hypothetical protein
MKYLIPISLLFLSSCVTQKKIEKYLVKHPEAIETIYITNDVHDTTIVTKDSVILEKITDTLYQWFTEYKYLDKVVTKWQIKQVLKPCEDSIVIVEKQVFVDRYKKVYEAAKKDRDATEKQFRWWQKGALLTWAWIILIAGVIYIIKRR